jgi:murein DD-endopeptidase MepM/ murein hydrolase activator NlpD
MLNKMTFRNALPPRTLPGFIVPALILPALILPALILPALTVCLLANPAHAQSSLLTLTPPRVEAGSPELIRVDAPSDASLTGEWLGRSLQFFRGSENRAWYALAGVDVQAPARPSSLKIAIRRPAGAITTFTRTVQILPAHYNTGKLTVPPRFVSPDPEALKQIKEEGQLKSRIFADSAGQPLWGSSFRAPVSAEATDSFGTRRMFNGKLASVHKGMDFRAKMGTPVRAGNSGIVVLARPLYFEGNCVIIDHGQGLFTESMHFSRIDVKEGQRVSTGEQLGLSGDTGRVTGPHLHWAVRWQGAYLDPAKLLSLDLTNVR